MNDRLRKIEFVRGFTKHADGSVLVKWGDTWVLCTASVEEKVPPFLKDTGKGWVTAEYSMLPSSTGGGRKERTQGNGAATCACREAIRLPEAEGRAA